MPLRHLGRATRDAWLRDRYPDQVAYYRAVVWSGTRTSPEAAVGGRRHERWPAMGVMQFGYLLEHGLRPGHRMRVIGGGNLRAGWRFIAIWSRATTTASTSRPRSSRPRRTRWCARGCRTAVPPSPRCAI
ncbi:hypothetical protein SANTM175S_02170 [Streptomyces antimycoticus]